MKVVKLSRTVDKRRLVVRNLATSLILFESIKTTPAKARAARMLVERLITRAKQLKNETDSGRTLAMYRMLLAATADELAAKKLKDVLADRFMARQGGYTRIQKLSRRLGDGAEQVVLSLTDRETPAASKKTTAPAKRSAAVKTEEK